MFKRVGKYEDKLLALGYGIEKKLMEKGWVPRDNRLLNDTIRREQTHTQLYKE